MDIVLIVCFYFASIKLVTIILGGDGARYGRCVSIVSDTNTIIVIVWEIYLSISVVPVVISVIVL